MKTNFQLNKIVKGISLGIMVAASITFSSCKKDSTTATDNSTSAEDHSNVNNAVNKTTDDAANVLGGVSATAGKTDGVQLFPCDATIDSSQKSQGIITINYNGSNCSGTLTRTGSITVTLQGYANGTRWRNQGAVLQIDFNNILVTNTATGAYITLNGTHYITNVTGGLAWRLLAGDTTGTVQHKIVSNNMSITFDNGAQRTWSVNRTRTFTNLNGVKSVVLVGDTTVNGVSDVDAFGTNRNGNEFVSSIAQPIASNSICGWYRPITGKFSHTVNGATLTILYGVDASGNQVTSGCAYGYKITYTLNGVSRSRVVSYWF